MTNCEPAGGRVLPSAKQTTWMLADPKAAATMRSALTHQGLFRGRGDRVPVAGNLGNRQHAAHTAGQVARAAPARHPYLLQVDQLSAVGRAAANEARGVDLSRQGVVSIHVLQDAVCADHRGGVGRGVQQLVDRPVDEPRRRVGRRFGLAEALDDLRALRRLAGEQDERYADQGEQGQQCQHQQQQHAAAGRAAGRAARGGGRELAPERALTADR